MTTGLPDLLPSLVQEHPYAQGPPSPIKGPFGPTPAGHAPKPTRRPQLIGREIVKRCFLPCRYRAEMSYHRRLATLLGTDPAQATADDVRKLLNNPLATEGQDLDHKREPHANGTEVGGELAKDIAAFANSTGGVLILGLQDDRKTSIPVHASRSSSPTDCAAATP